MLYSLRQNAGFQCHAPAVGHLLTCRFTAAAVIPPGRVAGLLEVHAKVDDVAHDLHMALRLHVAAHHAETHERLAVLRDERGNDRVKWTLARLENVGMPFFEREQRPAILKTEAQTVRHQPRPETAIITLDQRYHVTILIRNRQVDSIARTQTRMTRLDGPKNLLGMEQLTALGCIFLRDQLCGGQFAELRIGVEAGSVLVCDLLCFDHQVQEVARVVAHRRHVKILQDVEHLQRRDALPIGRQLPHVIAAVIGRDRLDPGRGVRREILISNETPDALAEGIHCLGERTPIERIATVLRECFVRLGQIRIAEDFAFGRSFAARQVRARKVWVFLQAIAEFPIVGNQFAERETFASIPRRGRKYFAHRQFAEFLVQLEPAVHTSRHRDRQRSEIRNLLEAFVFEVLQRQAFG